MRQRKKQCGRVMKNMTSPNSGLIIMTSLTLIHIYQLVNHQLRSERPLQLKLLLMDYEQHIKHDHPLHKMIGQIIVLPNMYDYLLLKNCTRLIELIMNVTLECWD